MAKIEDHPLRYALANELHARPFPSVWVPGFAVYLAIKKPNDAANRDRGADRAHLIDLLDRFGADHPKPDATHFFGDVGRYRLKWESHTEFVTYTIFGDGLSERPFDPAEFSVFPDDWLVAAPGVCLTSALIRIDVSDDDAMIRDAANDWFVPESVVVSHVLENNAVVAGDFRIDSAGHIRFAVFGRPGVGVRRMGRIVQRLCEIETYKSMSMLGLQKARQVSKTLGPIDQSLTELVDGMTGQHARPEHSLNELLKISAELEKLAAQSSFRFAGSGAYSMIVAQRIDVLRETHFAGRQTLAEFMNRRFDPAMRTVKSTERQLQSIAERAIRAGDLLRTQVDVERSEQNQKVLERMDERADLQLRLQKTVEGLSVVAISYYAVNLVGYMAAPIAREFEISKTVLTAVTTPLVLLGVWMVVRQIRKSMH